MKKILYAIFMVCPFVLFSQDILWEKSYGGKHAEYLYDAIPTPDYGFILAGSSVSGKNGNKESDNKGDLDYWVWKMDEDGNLDWQKSFGGNKVDLLQSIALTRDGGFILGGTSNSDKGLDKQEAGFGQEDFWIIKLNAKGSELWQKTIGGKGMEKLLSIQQTQDGGYILGGTSSSNAVKNEENTAAFYGKTEDSRGNLDYWVVKLNTEGIIEWQKTLGGQYADELKSIHQTKDGGYILGGYSNSPISGDKSEPHYGLGDYWVVKLDENGEQEWQRSLGGNKDDNLFSLVPTEDGGYLLGGSSNSDATDSKSKSSRNGSDFWVVKLNDLGHIDWQETYDYGKRDVLTSIVENKDGTFLIGGYAQPESKVQSQKSKVESKSSDKEGISDYIALKIKADGEEIWTQTVGSKGDEVLKKLLETRDGGYLLAGTSLTPPRAAGTGVQKSRDRNSGIGGQDFWVVKLKDNDKEENIRISLEAVPNPTAYFTNVILNFEYNSGTATLFDLAGRQLYSTQINGERTIPIDLTNLPRNVYVIHIDTDTEEGGVKVIKK